MQKRQGHKPHKLRSKETAESTKNEPKKKTPQLHSTPPKTTIYRVCANSLRPNSALHLSEKSLPLRARHHGRGRGRSKPAKTIFQRQFINIDPRFYNTKPGCLTLVLFSTGKAMSGFKRCSNAIPDPRAFLVAYTTTNNHTSLGH